MISDHKPEKTSDTPKLKKTHQIRCGHCNKKIPLINFMCDCGNTFCIKHMHSFEHECHFDILKKTQKKIQLENPIVKSSTLNKI